MFEENETARTQEFVLQWSSDGGLSVKEIVRQQWTFMRELGCNKRLSSASNPQSASSTPSFTLWDFQNFLAESEGRQGQVFVWREQKETICATRSRLVDR
jgi:hypothetical protein